MKAIVYKKYGPPDVLELTEVEKPIPEENQVLVKIHAASVNFGNLVLLKGEPFLARFAFGLLKPKYSIPGGDIAGRVEAVGKDVKQFQPGDEVFGDLSGLEPATERPSAVSVKNSKNNVKLISKVYRYF